MYPPCAVRAGTWEGREAMGVAASPAAQAAMNERHSQLESRVCGPLHKEGDVTEPRVVFYKLTSRFVDTEKDIPQESGDIVYYALAVGHNTGLCDCFNEELVCSVPEYRRIVELFPEGDARYKMEGIIRCDEIVVDRSHLKVLDEPVHKLAQQLAGDEGHAFEAQWLVHFADMLDAIKDAPEAYYMGRLRR